MLGFVIGDNSLVTGFRLVGMHGKEVASLEAAQEALKQALNRNEVAIVVISEEFSTQMRQQIEQAREENIKPLIVEVPSSKTTSSKVKLSEHVNRMLGFKI